MKTKILYICFTLSVVLTLVMGGGLSGNVGAGM